MLTIALAHPASGDFGGEQQFSFAGKEEEGERPKDAENGLNKLAPNSTALQSKTGLGGAAGGEASQRKNMPPASVMTRLILIMVWRKLIRNPNTYSSLIGLIWALVAFRLVKIKINCFLDSNRPVIGKFIPVLNMKVARGNAQNHSTIYLHSI